MHVETIGSKQKKSKCFRSAREEEEKNATLSSANADGQEER